MQLLLPASYVITTVHKKRTLLLTCSIRVMKYKGAIVVLNVRDADGTMKGYGRLGLLTCHSYVSPVGDFNI